MYLFGAMLTLEIILGILVKAALLLYTIKINVLVNNIYMYMNINIYIYVYIYENETKAWLILANTD